MKARLTKLFTLLTILTLGITNVWAVDIVPSFVEGNTANAAISTSVTGFGNFYFASRTTTTKNTVTDHNNYRTPKGNFVFELTSASTIDVTLYSGSNGRSVKIGLYTVDATAFTVWQNAAGSASAMDAWLVSHKDDKAVDGETTLDAYFLAKGFKASSGHITSSSDNQKALMPEATYNAEGLTDPGKAIYTQYWYPADATSLTRYESTVVHVNGGNSIPAGKYLMTIGDSGSGMGIEKITITASAPAATYDATFANGGHGTAPADATGVSSVTLTEITGVDGWKNTGWTADVATKVGTTDKAAGATLNIGDVVTLLENTTFTAQWANKYTVTYDKNGGTGTMADTYNEIVACTFTAPDGKAFKEWNTQADGNGTTYAVGASVAGDLNLFAIWKSTPQTIFSWRNSETSAPSSSEAVVITTTTGGTTTACSSDFANKKWAVEDVAYDATVPADLKATVSKGLKTGGNALFLQLTLSGTEKFQEGDTIWLCGYGSWMVSTTTEHTGDVAASMSTGAGSKTSCKAVYAVIPEGINTNTLYVRRVANTIHIAAIKVVRPAARTIISMVVELTSASIGDDALSAADFATLTTGPAYMYALENKANEAPTMHFNKRTTITYDEGDPKVTNEDIAVAATDNGAGYWQAQATVNAITYTIKVAKPATYEITYYPGANGSGSIEPGNKAEDVAFILSSERFTRAGYLQTGWATADGGAQAYALGGTYTENAALDLYPVWTELSSYNAVFSCGTTPAGWTFSNDGFDADNKATVASVCTFVDNGLGTPKQTTGDGTSDDDVAFAKNTDAIATYDLGITTTVAALDVVLTGGSSSAFNEEIELLGADGTTVKQSYTTSLSAGNWRDNAINKTDIIEDVRYIRVHGASKWIVMKSFSVSYIETRTKYDVAFAAGTGASGSMPTLHYVEGVEVVLPASTFTAPTDKEFDVWTSSDVTITDGKFTMPAKNVTVTATWKDAVTRFTVTFETNGGSSIDDQEVEINGHPAAVDDPTKDNYVFVGWYNNSDLADEHAVADITALTITEDITLYAKWALDLQVTKIVFSNGFDAFINGNTVTAYYMDGEAAPTIESYEANANVKTTDGVLIEGSKLVLVGTDDSRKEYNFTLDAVAPMTSFDKQTFDGSETYIKGGSGFAAERGWKFQKNADDGRIPKGLTRLYVFLGGGADKATFKSYAKRAVHVYVNNVLVSSVTELPSDAEFEIPLNPSDATNMIAFISNQTGGDAGIFDVKLNEHTISSDATLGALTVNGDAVTLVDGVFEYDVELAYGTSSAPTIVATANDAGAVATVVSCTLSGATIEVVPESGASDKKTYTLTFTVSRYPKIIIWDGATMSAVATSPDASGLEWAVTGFGSIANYSVSLDGKDYVKCLPSGGNGGAARNISLTIPDGYVGRVTIVFGSHSDDERGMFIGKTATKTLDETSILTLYSPGRTSLVKGTSLWSGGTYYINPMASVDFYEITVELTPGYARTDMLGAGVLGTICVDHNVAINEAFGASFYELAGKEATYGKIVFEEIIAGELEAGKPYVFQAEGNLIALLYGSTSVSAPVNTGALKGTFTGELFTAEQAAEKDIYFFRDHALWSAKETGLQVLANRAWLEMGDVNPITNPNPAPGRRRITLGVNGTNVATGLEDLEVGEAPMKVMMNGQLFILRGEKIYDATGRLVK